MIETKKEKPTVYIDNLVGTVSLAEEGARSLDLSNLYFVLQRLIESGLLGDFREAVKKIKYKPEKFSALTINLNKPRASVNVFSSWRMNCAGCAKKEDMELAIKTVAALIKFAMKPAVLPINDENFSVEISNVVCSSDVGKSLGCGVIQKAFPDIEVKISKFAGGTYKVSYNGGTLMIFAGGKIMALGFKDIDVAKNTVLEAIQRIIQAIDEYGGEDRSQVCKLERFEPTSKFIENYAAILEISEEVKFKAIDLIRQYCQKVTKETFGGEPESFAAAAIYIASLFCNQGLTQFYIHSKVGVSEVSLRSARDKIKNTLELEIIL